MVLYLEANRQMTNIKSISVSEEFSELAKKYHISWSEAARVGMAVMLSEMGELDLFNKTNVGRKIKLLTGLIGDLNKKVQTLEEKKP